MKTIPTLSFVICLFWLLVSVAWSGVLYTDEQLREAGKTWQETKRQWELESAAHKKVMKRIDKSPRPEVEKTLLRRKENIRHKKRSNQLAGKRHEVQQKLIKETNARARSGKGKTSQPLKESLGTKYGDLGHRGMAGDLDAGGGAGTTEKMKDVLKDMGIEAKVVEHAGTISVEDSFEFTVNKTGIDAAPGSDFHKVQVEVDAANPETYLSESMKQRNAKGEVIGKNVGTDYVEVQDHRRKAMEGLKSDGLELTRKGRKNMQPMAKGAKKVLDMGQEVISDAALEKVLKQRGIKDTPTAAEFKRKLTAIKEGNLRITDPVEAQKLRDVSDDIFNMAEKTTSIRKDKEFAALRKKIEELPPNSPQRKKLKNQLIDSKAKIDTSKKVNDDIFSGKRKPEPLVTQGRGTKPPETTPKQKQIAGADGPEMGGRSGKSNAPEVSAGNTAGRMKQLGQKAKKVWQKTKVVRDGLGVIMIVSDIGNTCKQVEEYMEGKRPLSNVIKTLVDIPMGGAIATGETIGTKYGDWQKTKNAINQTNKQNMEAFLTQWEIRLRKAGLSKEEAKQYVGNAVLLGNLDILEKKAEVLRKQGKTIISPELIVETIESDDTLWERTKMTAKGIVTGTVEGVGYIVKAPYRIVEALGKREIAEAELELASVSKVARTKVALYRKLRQNGINSKEALRAVNDWEDGDGKKLKALTRKVRNNKFISVRRQQKDWYCTNRPVISSPAPMSELINQEIDRRNRWHSLFGQPLEEKRE